MPALEFEWDSRDLKFWRSRKLDKALFKALSKAGGDAARAMKRQSAKDVRQRKRFKLAKVNKSMKLVFPRGKRELKDLIWRLDVSGAPIPLAELPYRQTAQGVEVEIKPGKQSLVKSAFVATMKSGHTGIFRRRGAKRLPIDEGFTARVSDVMQDDGVIPDVFEQAQTVFAQSFERLLPLEVRKLT
jgi:hypothetical protein